MNQLSVSLNQVVTVVFYHHGNIISLKGGVVTKITPKKQDITVEFKDGTTSKFNSDGHSNLGGTWSTSRAEIVNVNNKELVEKINEFKEEYRKSSLIKTINTNLTKLDSSELDSVLEQIKHLIKNKKN